MTSFFFFVKLYFIFHWRYDWRPFWRLVGHESWTKTRITLQSNFEFHWCHFVRMCQTSRFLWNVDYWWVVSESSSIFFFKLRNFKNLEYYFNVRSPWNRNCLWIIYWFGSFVYHRGGPCSSSWRFGNVQSIGSYFRNSVEVCGHFSFHKLQKNDKLTSKMSFIQRQHKFVKLRKVVIVFHLSQSFYGPSLCWHLLPPIRRPEIFKNKPAKVFELMILILF